MARAPCDPLPARLWPLTPRQIANSLEALLPASELEAVIRNDGVVQTDFFGVPRSRFESELTTSLSLTTSFAEPFSSQPDHRVANAAFVKAVYEGVRSLTPRLLRSEKLPTCANAPDESCAHALIDTVGRQLYRRPVLDSERTELLAFFRTQAERLDETRAFELLLRRLQMSPATFFRSEMGAAKRGGPLTAHEVADVIAFSATDAPPDAMLAAAADDLTLLQPEVARAHAERLVGTEPSLGSLIASSPDDPKSARGLMRFYREWLDMDAIRREERSYLGQIIVSNPDNGKRTRIPASRVQRWFDNEMMQFAWWVTYRSSGRLSELLTSDQLAIFGSTTLLATHRLWDILARDEEDTVGTHPAPAVRRGILSHRGLLTAHDSPSTRGAFIRSAFLCQDLVLPEAADNNLEGFQDQLEEEEGRDLLPREVRDRHLNDPQCSGCHQLIDPMGFPFDIFEKAGLERSHYAGVRYAEGEPRGRGNGAQVPDLWHGQPIDTSGAVIGTRTMDGPVMDHVRLVERLAEGEEVRACVASKVYHFVNGVTGQAANRCDLEEAVAGFEATEGNLPMLYIDLVTQAALRPRLEIP